MALKGNYAIHFLFQLVKLRLFSHRNIVWNAIENESSRPIYIQYKTAGLAYYIIHSSTDYSIHQMIQWKQNSQASSSKL